MKRGVITDCLVTNVYPEPNISSDVIEFLNALSEVEILDDLISEDYVRIDNGDRTYCYQPIKADGFLKVKTKSGNVGYIQRRYLAIREDDSA